MIRTGWRISGLCPYNPEPVLDSSQVTGRPLTPTNDQAFSENLNQVFSTPWSSHEIYIATPKRLQTETPLGIPGDFSVKQAR